MILILEDDIDILDIHADLLAQHFRGVPILCAASVQTALPLVAKHAGELRLLVTDYQLGDGTGTQVALALKELRRGIPCLLVTSAPQWVSASEFELFEQVLVKPVARSQFLHALQQVPGFAA